MDIEFVLMKILIKLQWHLQLCNVYHSSDFNKLFLFLLIDIPSIQKKAKTPAQKKTVIITDKCVIPLEPLVFNGNSGTPVKRRASRSIPDESSVTFKKSRVNLSVKKTKGPLNSPRQRYGINSNLLLMHSCTLSVTAVIWGKTSDKNKSGVKNPEKPNYPTQQIDELFWRFLCLCYRIQNASLIILD